MLRAYLALVFAALAAGQTPEFSGLPPGMGMPGAGGGAGGGDVETHNAEELDDDTFEERLLDSELLLVLFRRRGQLAQNAEKEFELAATELAGEEAALTLGMVEIGSKGTRAALRRAKVEPDSSLELRLWRGGKTVRLPGGMQVHARSIVDTVRYLSAPVSLRFGDNSTALNEWLRNAQSALVLGIFADEKRPSHQLWSKGAEALRPPYRFGEVSVAGARGSKLFAGAELDEGKNQYAVVRPHKWLGKGEAAYVLDSDFRQMKAFIHAHETTKVGPLSAEGRARFVAEKKAMVHLYFDTAALGKMWKYVLNRMHKLIDAEPELTSHFGFTIFDRKPQEDSLLADFGVDGSRDFVVTAVNFSTRSGYGSEALAGQPADGFSMMGLVPFLRSLLAGEATPFVKSEAVPERKVVAPGEVGKVVAATWDEVVCDAETDVLVGLSTHKAPPASLAEAAQLLKPVSRLRVYAMNATVNAFDYAKYPLYSRDSTALFLVPANGTSSCDTKPRALDSHKDGIDADAPTIASFALKHALTPPADVRATLRKQLKALTAANKKAAFEAAGIDPSIVSEGEPHKAHRRRRRAKAKGGRGKDEV